MELSGIGAGLASLAFWGFVAAVVVGGMWYAIREKEAQHETIRRLVESGQALDEEVLARLSLLGAGEKRHDREYKMIAMYILPVGVGMGIFGMVMGTQYPETLAPLLGVGALLLVMGAGFWVAGKVAERWYRE